jgi:flagellar biosynthesis protein FlhB
MDKETRFKAFDITSEWSKQLVTVAAAVVALSATFVHDVIGANQAVGGWLVLSWVLLLASVVTGVLLLGALIAQLNRARDASTLDVYHGASRWFAVAQLVTFVVGLVAFVIFFSTNISSHRASQATHLNQQRK